MTQGTFDIVDQIPEWLGPKSGQFEQLQFNLARTTRQPNAADESVEHVLQQGEDRPPQRLFRESTDYGLMLDRQVQTSECHSGAQISRQHHSARLLRYPVHNRS